MKIAVSRLREVLDYDPMTGVFRWLVSPSQSVRAGRRAGCIERGLRGRGRIVVQIDGGQHKAHRLAWLYMYGKWPIGQIDHINGDATDNRIENLRDVPACINSQNQRRAQRHSTTGLLGASPTPGCKGFRARIDGRQIGRFPTAKAAHEAYLEAKRERHEGCSI